MRDIIGTEVAVGSFSKGSLVGQPQRCRVIRATRACVTLQRYACGGWHTGSHGRVTVAWTGRERGRPGVLTTIVWPPDMAALRVAAGLGGEYRRAAITTDGRLA